MRIAIEASTWINPRGYGRFTREITRAMLQHPGHDYTLVLDSGAAGALDLPDAARVVVPTRRSVADSATATGARSAIDIWRMSGALSSKAFDAVIFPTLYSFVPVRRGPLVTVVIHDVIPETLPRLALGGWRARTLWNLKRTAACRRADMVATVSEASARAIQEHLRLSASPVVLTEGPSDHFSPTKRPHDAQLVESCVSLRGRIILYVGGLSPHKRVPDLIRAFKSLVNKGGTDLVLVIVGPDVQDHFASAASAVDNLTSETEQYAERIIRTGYVSDETLAALYRAATCVVMPSLQEGFGLPAVEAMASGTPLVTARAEALLEVCGDAAEFFEGPDDLAPTLARLLENETRQSELSSVGLQRAQRFSWNEGARRLLVAIEATKHEARLARNKPSPLVS